MSDQEINNEGGRSLSPLKQAFLALEQSEARVRALESGLGEPIAIVGIGCRFPGNEEGPNGYWSFLENHGSAVNDRVEERFAGLLRGKRLPLTARYAALLERIDLFEPRHFEISPREATGMDPQQRLLLEVSWEALEDAGIDPFALYQSATGVYVGIASHDYAHLQVRTGNQESLDLHFASGVASSVASGRLSYILGLNGPSLSVDTACSSSLVTVHLACEALHRGECTMALAGGVNMILSPESAIALAQAGMLSPGGLVRSFDAGADGFVRGEGCGVVVLRRLSDAERSGDRILGVILGSSVNQDGASSGLTVPNGLAQQALLREAHRRSGIEAWQVGYVEAHGTGTRLGDPIEAEALGAVFGSGRARGSKLAIGSVKTNLGHLESAAGVAGLIKVVLGLEHGVIPGQLHWTGPSEHVRWSELPLEVVTESRVWEPIAGRRIGGVSSFGFSGTNAHVVVEGWDRREDAVVESGPVLEVLVVTSRTEAGLRALVERYAVYLETVDAVWSDVCYTASVGRGVFGERLAVMASDRSEAAAKLRDWLRSAAGIAGVYRGQVSAGRRGAGAALAGDAAVERVAAQFVNGGPIDWPGYWSVRSGGASRRRIALPTYAFQRERYWIEPGEGEASAEARAGVATGRGLLGHRLRSAGVQGQYETHLLASGWIGDHVVESRVVLPGTGHLELMLEAGAELMGPCCVVEDVVFQAPLVVEKKRRVQTVVEEAVAGRSRVRVYAERSGEGAEGEWERVSEGWLRAEPAASEAPASPDVDKIRSRLTHQMGHDAIYTAMTERGLGFGPRFRGLSQVWTGPAEALGEIVRTTDHEQGWELEPWWLDACLQAAGMAVQADVQEEDGALYLPMGLDRLTLYQAGRANNRTPAWSHATVRRIDPQTLTAQIHITNTQGHTLLHIQNIQFRKKIEKEEEKIASWMYQLDWQQSERIHSVQDAAIEDMAAELDERMGALSRSSAILEYGSFFLELEDLSAAYIIEAFQKLGWVPGENEPAMTEQVLQRHLGILPQHARLLHRMIEIGEEIGLIEREVEGFRLRAGLSQATSKRVGALTEKFPFGKVELDLVVRCGASLAEVLQGLADGHELVFPEGQSEEMGRLYRDAVPAQIYNGMLAELVARFVKSRGQEPVRILEIGGGTAATTHYVLEALRSQEIVPDEYLFTDISPLLVRRAESSLRENTFFHGKAFNLEREGKEQGIDGPFEIILAVNVIHATTDIAATLERLKPLLTENGMLILVEVTGKQRWADITVGLLSGWWHFIDHQLRSNYPSLASGAWKPFLESSGFERVQTLPKLPDKNSIFGRQELIITQKTPRPRRVGICGTGSLADNVRRLLILKNVLVEVIDEDEVSEQTIKAINPDAVIWLEGKESISESIPLGGASQFVEHSVSSLLKLTQALIQLSEDTQPRLYVGTTEACSVLVKDRLLNLSATSLLGMTTGIAAEAPALRCTRFDCSDESAESQASQIVEEVLSEADDRIVAWRSGQRYVATLKRMESEGIPQHIGQRVQLATHSGIDGLHFASTARQQLSSNDIEIAVRATALNFRDVLQSLGVVNLDLPLGSDCAGIVVRVGDAVQNLRVGDEVVAIASGCFADFVVTSATLAIRKPQGLSFADAAAQSVAYLTADYCLNEIGRMRKGDRVLVHAAAGGVGLAAIHLCHQVGAVPIATAGSDKKRSFLRGLGVLEVYDSRSLSFADQISGDIDIILNSLAGEAIDRGLGLLKPRGRFIEIGKTDVRSQESMERTWPAIKYLPVDLSPLFSGSSPWVHQRLETILLEVSGGSLPTLPATLFRSDEVKDAFRYMARAEHIGRIVVQRNSHGSFRGAHLIAGGMRGIGLRLMEWLAAQGVQKFVLVGRSAPDAKASALLARLRSKGIDVDTIQGDIADPQIVRSAILAGGSALRGVWHSAGVLDLTTLGEQTWSRIQRVLRPKMDGAWNLHVLTKHLDLDLFVLFSSWASIAGVTGQANHCAANAFLDGLAYLRRNSGLPALSVNWGAWAEIGAAASEEVRRKLSRSGMDSMQPADALEALQQALRSEQIQVAIASIEWPRYLTHHPKKTVGSFYSGFLAEQCTPRSGPTTSFVENNNRSSSVFRESTSSSEFQIDGLATLLGLPASARQTGFLNLTSDFVRRILDLKITEEIDPDIPFSNLGMDSLLSIELRNALSVSLGKQFPSTIVFDYPTLRTLSSHLHEQIAIVHLPDADRANVASLGTDKTIPKIQCSDILGRIEQMSDEEVESLFD